HEVVELVVLDLDPALDRVVPGRRAIVGHAEADRALVLVGGALGDETPSLVLAAFEPVELEGDGTVPVDAEPCERALDLLDRLGDLPARVSVLDPQPALAAAASREEPVEEEGAHAADVEEPGRARSHTHSHRHEAGIV